MTFFHAFWSGPVVHNLFEPGHRYHQLRTNLYCYAASALYIKSFGHRIELYADELAAEWLRDVPYDEIHIIDMSGRDLCFAAQIKFDAYSMCNPGDCYIDGDVFLWKPEVFDEIAKLKDYDIVVQSLEAPPTSISPIYEATREALSGVKFPWEVCPKKPIAYNAGFVLFNNTDARLQYVENYKQCMKLCPKEKSNIGGGIWFDLILEQQFFVQWAKPIYNVALLIGIQDNADNEIYQERAINMGYMHMGGDYKYQHMGRLEEMIWDLDKNVKIALDDTIREAICKLHSNT